MNRDQMLRALTASADPWDLIIIGGGATGLGAAVDAAARGYRTLLLEQGDFAKGTSSRSTKLIHGGVRYLQQGNLKLVRESLRERGLHFVGCGVSGGEVPPIGERIRCDIHDSDDERLVERQFPTADRPGARRLDARGQEAAERRREARQLGGRAVVARERRDATRGA